MLAPARFSFEPSYTPRGKHFGERIHSRHKQSVPAPTLRYIFASHQSCFHHFRCRSSHPCERYAHTHNVPTTCRFTPTHGALRVTVLLHLGNEKECHIPLFTGCEVCWHCPAESFRSCYGADTPIVQCGASRHIFRILRAKVAGRHPPPCSTQLLRFADECPPSGCTSVSPEGHSLTLPSSLSFQTLIPTLWCELLPWRDDWYNNSDASLITNHEVCGCYHHSIGAPHSFHRGKYGTCPPIAHFRMSDSQPPPTCGATIQPLG